MFILLIISEINIHAQEFPLVKQKQDLEIWTYTNLLHKLEGGSYFFARLHTQSLAKAKSLLNFKQYRFGYAQFLQKNLHLGVFVQTDTKNTFTYRFFLKHRSKIAELDLIKRLSFESLAYADPLSDDLKRGRLRLGLSYPIKLGAKKKFYPLISYEVFKTFDKQDPLQNQRKIDRTRWRLDLNYEFSPKVRLLLFFLKETNYYFALAQFKLDNNGQMIQIKPERRLNLIKPVYAFSLFINLNKDKKRI